MIIYFFFFLPDSRPENFPGGLLHKLLKSPTSISCSPRRLLQQRTLVNKRTSANPARWPKTRRGLQYTGSNAFFHGGKNLCSVGASQQTLYKSWVKPSFPATSLLRGYEQSKDVASSIGKCY